MKILSVTAQKPHSTGSGTYMTELVNSFARAGHEQAVVFGITPEDTYTFPEGVSTYPVFFKSEFSDAKSDNHKIYKTDISFPVVGMSDVMPYESTLYRDLTTDMIEEFENAFVGVLRQAVDALNPDLIICHHLFLLTAIVKKHFPERRIYGVCHGTDLRQMENCPDLAAKVTPHLSQIDLFLALHSDQKNRIVSIYNISEDKVKVIGSGYNDSLFNVNGRISRRKDEAVRICYAGKISRPKGVPEFLRTIIMLDKSNDIKVTLAGGCQDDFVMSLLNTLPEYANWLGQIPQPELANLFRQNDIFVLPSYFEGLPLVLIEAMACGAVPVCTDLPGIRPWLEENVPDHNVIFVPMPEMQSVDMPTAEGRLQFTCNLADAIQDAINKTKSHSFRNKIPNTSGITWDAVSAKIISFSFI